MASLFCRTFIETPDWKEAQNITGRIIEFINERHHNCKFKSNDQYWKIPEYFETSFEDNNYEYDKAKLLNLISQFGIGWEKISDLEYVWSYENQKFKKKFKFDKVRWFNIEIIG